MPIYSHLLSFFFDSLALVPKFLILKMVFKTSRLVPVLVKQDGVVGAVGIISAFRPQDPGFDPQFCRDFKICVTFFSTQNGIYLVSRS